MSIYICNILYMFYYFKKNECIAVIFIQLGRSLLQHWVYVYWGFIRLIFCQHTTVDKVCFSSYYNINNISMHRNTLTNIRQPKPAFYKTYLAISANFMVHVYGTYIVGLYIIPALFFWSKFPIEWVIWVVQIFPDNFHKYQVVQ